MSVLDTLPRLSLLIRYPGVLLAMDPCGPLLGPHWFNRNPVKIGKKDYIFVDTIMALASIM